MNKRCRICSQLKSVNDFNFKDKQRGARNTCCKTCSRAIGKRSYYRNRGYYLKKAIERNIKLKEQKQRFLYNYLLTNPCVDCGISDPVVLHFDHVRGVKKLSIAIMVKRRISLKTIIQEIGKCEVRCANCHSRKTVSERGYYKYLEELIS